MSGVIFLCVELSRGMGESYWRDCQSSGRYPVGQLLVKEKQNRPYQYQLHVKVNLLDSACTIFLRLDVALK